MGPVTHETLGVLIAYILPGFTILWGASWHSPLIRTWLEAPPENSPTVAGFLFVTIASLGLGIFSNLIRGLLLDPLHHYTGIRKHDRTYTPLQKNLAAIEFIVTNQFRFYQFAGNMFLAVLCYYVAAETSDPGVSWKGMVLLIIVEAILWFGSRRHLRTYYQRLEEVLCPSPSAGAESFPLD